MRTFTRPTLTELQAKILHILWAHGREGGLHTGLTRNEIVAQLQNQGVTRRDIKSPLMELEQWNPRLLKKLDAQPGQTIGTRGPRPQAYQILYDHMITQPTMARIVMELSKSGIAAERARFVERVYSLGLRTDDASRAPLTPAQIESQLKFATEHGYVETAMDTDGSARLRTTDRMLKELPFLQKIAST